MTYRLVPLAAALLAMLFLSACSSVEKAAEDISNRSFARYAIGRPYTQVANLPDYEADTLGRVKMFGQPIGSYRLASGEVVHRHVKQEVRGGSSVDLGMIRTSDKRNYVQRIYYLLAGQDGVVRDVATGSVPGGSSSCVSWVSGIVQKCENREALVRTYLEYDSVVKTTSGQPISSWGPQDASAFQPSAPDADDGIRPLAADAGN